MSTYQTLLDEAIAIANEYSMASFLYGFDSSLINVLLMNHEDTIRSCTTYAITMLAITRALSLHIGTHINIEAFITQESHRVRLYEIFAEWRHQLLSDIMFSS